MAKSKRLDILVHLCQVLESIFPDNGYDNDLRGRVYRGRTSISTGGDEDRRAAISIQEPKTINPGTFADDLSTYRKDRWVLLIQGWVTSDANNFEHPTDPAYALAADVEKCLSGIVSTGAGGQPSFPGIYLLGKKIAAMELSQPTVRAAEDQNTDRAYFYLPVALTLASDISQPGDR